MYDNYIELMIEGMTRGRELQDAFILVLRERRANVSFQSSFRTMGTI